MQLEVVELLDDLLAGLAREELGVLDDRRVDLLEAEAARDLAEVREEPAPQAQVLGIEVARAARRLELVVLTASPTARSIPPAARPSARLLNTAALAAAEGP